MSNLSEFLITTGRTLSQMSLYTMDHPSVKGAVQDSHRLLISVLSEVPEITLSILDKKFLINGKPQTGAPESALRPFVVLMNNFGLHSLTFTVGIAHEELVPFFNLASKGDKKKLGMELSAYLTSQNVTHIKANLAKYAKIGENEIVTEAGEGTGGDGAGDGAGAEGLGKGEALLQELSTLNLNDLLAKLVDRAIPDPGDRRQILSRALDLVKKQLDEAIKKAAAEYAVEKTKLTNERERTENVINNVADGVVVVDEAGNVLMMNPSAEQIYGVKLGECVGKPLWQGVRQEQMVALAKDLAIPTDRPVTKEVQLQAEAETKRILRASSASVQDVSGRVVGMVSVLSDVTKHKELTRLQNEFMANVTHDLRTPIHALKLAVAAILEGAAGPVSGEQNKMLSLANRNVERLSRLIDDLLDFSQIESGSMQIKPQVMELSPILGDSVASLDAWVKSRGIILVFEEGPAIPPVYADSDRILQVVSNLLSNAVKFTPSGGKVTLRAKEVRDKGRQSVQIEIEDTGKGISPEDQARIFQRFVQLKNQEKLDIRGTGLGLSICKALVELHKGALSLQSPPPGKPNGTLFYFTLPAVQKADVQTPRQPAASVAAPVKKAGFWSKMFSKFKILFILFTLAPFVLQARPFSGKVRRILEGDVIQLTDGTKVRYLGIDAPDKDNDHFQESLSGNKRFVEGKDVFFRYALQEKNTEGDWIAYVYTDGVFVNEEMVRYGLALVDPLSNDKKILAALIRAEREAQREKRGLWKDSGDSKK